MADVKKVWNNYGNKYLLSSPSEEFEKLENAIYGVGFDSNMGFFLTKKSDKFEFDYKLYGLETSLVTRALKTYNATEGNLGILLNGVKGTGKTVTSKIIANKLNQPIIVVSANLDGITSFLNSIPQDVTIFIDEYEKIFGESSAMLTIMDGALTSQYRRVFLLTTNNLRLDENLIERPSRIRYLKKFEFLSPEIVIEIVDDILEHKDLRAECISFISNLETITVDIVKAVLNEVNIHAESPTVFSDVFNVKKLKGKYNLSVRNNDGSLSDFALDVNSSPRPTFSDRNINDSVRVNGETIGFVKRIINWTTIEVEPRKISGHSLGFDEPIILSYEDADMINNSFTYDGFGSINTPKVATFRSKSAIFEKTIYEIAEYDDYEGSDDDFVKMKKELTLSQSN